MGYVVFITITVTAVPQVRILEVLNVNCSGDFFPPEADLISEVSSSPKQTDQLIKSSKKYKFTGHLRTARQAVSQQFASDYFSDDEKSFIRLRYKNDYKSPRSKK